MVSEGQRVQRVSFPRRSRQLWPDSRPNIELVPLECLLVDGCVMFQLPACYSAGP